VKNTKQLLLKNSVWQGSSCNPNTQVIASQFCGGCFTLHPIKILPETPTLR